MRRGSLRPSAVRTLCKKATLHAATGRPTPILGLVRTGQRGLPAGQHASVTAQRTSWTLAAFWKISHLKSCSLFPSAC
ncbi:hypothetical protein WJX77_001347 [Trebouxia sp. C0004]